MHGGIGGSGRVDTTQITETREIQGTGQGLGDHQARVGQPRGRGIGRMIMDGVKAVGRGIVNFFAKIKECFTPRVQVDLPDLQVPLLDDEIEEPLTRVGQCLQDFDQMIDIAKESDFSLGGFTEGCIQCMNDDSDGQIFLRTHLDDTAYSKENFTGIENHHSDPSKFIAKFGSKQIEFSDRMSSNFELRGTLLRGKLENSEYGSLRELIDPLHGGESDVLLRGAVGALQQNLILSSSNMSTSEKLEVLESVQDKMLGPFRFGDVCDLSFLRS